MNLISETKRRLEYLNKELDDLKEFCVTTSIYGIAREHLNDEVSRTEKNIQYYSEVLEKLEDE